MKNIKTYEQLKVSQQIVKLLSTNLIDFLSVVFVSDFLD